MIGWQNAAALWALPLALLPVVIHLLRTHHARRVLFPSLRFVQPSRTAAVRMRLPSDIPLMLLRVAAVALAVTALAGPILLTSSRMAAWNARTARAVVVDASDSMRASPDGTEPAEKAAADAAAAESQSVAYVQRVDARDLAEGLARASKWLESSPPARREIVVVSDMQRGALRRTDLGRVADGIGIRLVTVGRPPETTRFDAIPLVGADGIPVRDVHVAATADTTSVEIRPARPDSAAGLRLIGSPQDQAAVVRLMRAVASAGAPAGSAQQPLAIQFAGANATQAPPARVQPGWMLRTVLRLQAGLPAAAAKTVADKDDGVWTTVSRGGEGVPRVRAAAAGPELLVDIDARPDTLAAAEIVRALLRARVAPAPYAEHEVARLDDTTMKALSRAPGPVSRDAWRHAESTDGRWLWLAVLVVLGVEQWLRDRTLAAAKEVKRAA
jgi:hypothetical protein